MSRKIILGVQTTQRHAGSQTTDSNDESRPVQENTHRCGSLCLGEVVTVKPLNSRCRIHFSTPNERFLCGVVVKIQIKDALDREMA